MWDDDECQRRRLGRAELLSSWGITAAILLGLAAWSGLHILTAGAPPSAAGSSASTAAFPVAFPTVAAEPRVH